MRVAALVVVSLGLALSACKRQSSLEAASADLDPAGDGARAPPPGDGSIPPPAQRPSPNQTAPSPAPAPGSAPSTNSATRAGSGGAAAPAPAARPSSPPPSGESADISTSPGQPGGVVVLWPRIIPRGSVSSDLAGRVQQHVANLARSTLPGRPMDIRPEPQRTCRRAGCDATAISVLLSASNNGCVAVAVVTPPGPVETTLLPWGGRVDLKTNKIPFRSPPESQVQVTDFASCDRILESMGHNDQAVAAALRAAAPPPP